MTKEDIRSEYKKKRKLLSTSNREMINENVKGQLIDTFLSMYSYDDNFCVHCYQSNSKWIEIRTDIFLIELKALFPNCKACYPKEKENYELDSIDDNGNIVDPSDINVIIVPTIAVDSVGNRIGYGKGYYDRYLKKCNTDILSIGICWFDPVEKPFPASKDDIPMKAIIYPKPF